MPGLLSFGTSGRGQNPASELPKWGVNVHLTSALASAAQTLSLMQAVGANCARDALNWDHVETSEGVYVWTGTYDYQDWWNTFINAGIYPVFLLTYNNALYSANGVFSIVTAGANTTAFGNYALAAFAEFKSVFASVGAAFELFNEPNYTGFTGGSTWAGGPFATFVQSVAASIRGTYSLGSYPKTAIISGGVVLNAGGTTGPTFAAQMAAGATMSSVDQYAYHPYNYNEGTPTATLTPEQMAIDVPAFAAGFGSQQKPIAITEYNDPLNALNDGNALTTATLELQGIYVAWGMLEAAALGATAHVVYDLIDDGTPSTASDQYTFGLYLNEGDSPSYGIKPAGTAFATVTSFFANALSYSVTDYPALSVREITVWYANGARAKAIWQSPAGASLGTPMLSGITYSENMGTFASPTATDALGNSISLTVVGSTISFPLSQAVGPVFVTLPL